MVQGAQEAFAEMYNSAHYGLEALNEQASRYVVCRMREFADRSLHFTT